MSQARRGSWGRSLATDTEDFRAARGTRHLRSDILRMAVCTGIGGVNSVAGLAEFRRDPQAWCETWRVLQQLDPRRRRVLFARWVEGLTARSPATGVVGDSQTWRRAHDQSLELPALPMVSTWSTAQGVARGQEVVALARHASTALLSLRRTRTQAAS